MSGTVISTAEYAAASAEIFVLGAICVILLVDVFLSDRTRWVTYALSLLALVGAAFVTVNYSVDARLSAFSGTFVADPMGEHALLEGDEQDEAVVDDEHRDGQRPAKP